MKWNVLVTKVFTGTLEYQRVNGKARDKLRKATSSSRKNIKKQQELILR